MSITWPAIGAATRVPVLAAMSMPLCGLRDWPLNTRRSPKVPERRPATGCSMCRSSDAGIGSEKVAITSARCARSPSKRAWSAADRSTVPGATLSRCSLYCLGSTE